MSMTMSAPAASPQAKGADLIKDTTTQAFAKDVLEESRRQPVLVDFWAPWCGPCKMLAPTIDTLANEYAGKIRIGKLNTDDNPNTASSYSISGIPTVAQLITELKQQYAKAQPELLKKIGQNPLACPPPSLPDLGPAPGAQPPLSPPPP